LLLQLVPLALAEVVTLAVTAAGVLGALALFWGVRNMRARFLFVRPEAFKLTRQAGDGGWSGAVAQPGLGA
jgi:hypothetical protein